MFVGPKGSKAKANKIVCGPMLYNTWIFSIPKCGYSTTVGKYAWILSYYWGICVYSAGIEPIILFYRRSNFDYNHWILKILYTGQQKYNKVAKHKNHQ